MCAAGVVITLWSANNAKKIKQFLGHENRWVCLLLLCILHTFMCRVESIQLKVYEDDYKHNIILSCSKDSTIKYWNIKRYHMLITLLEVIYVLILVVGVFVLLAYKLILLIH